jgi:hypothetical protein
MHSYNPLEKSIAEIINKLLLEAFDKFCWIIALSIKKFSISFGKDRRYKY